MTRIVLAYSGQLESSVAVRWLAERHQAEVITVTLDLGQGRAVEQARDQALAAGAARAHVLDAVQVFADRHVLPVLHAGAIATDAALIGALARPLVARRLVEIAEMEGATAVAHAGLPAGVGETPVERLLRSLAPSLTVLAPGREWHSAGERTAVLARGYGLASGSGGGWRVEANAWGRSYLADIDGPVAADPFTLTRDPHDAPAEPAFVDLDFVEGTPVSVSGVPMPVPELLEALTTIAGAHGVGRGAGVCVDGGRVLSESPAGAVLRAAHGALQSAVTPAELRDAAGCAAVAYRSLLDRGAWFSPLRDALDAFAGSVQTRVTGTVRLRLVRGTCDVIEVRPAPAAGRLPVSDHRISARS